MDSVKLDFCPRCRRVIDWALDAVPLQDIYIRANHEGQPPSEGHLIVPLCDKCGKFTMSTLKVDGFTIYTP